MAIDLNDCQTVVHQAGNRAPQQVKKYKGTCDQCGADRGYIFKSFSAKLCSSCSHKNSYKAGKVINDNHNGLKCVKNHPEQGEVTLKSSYELFYYNYLIRHKIKFKYEAKRFTLASGDTYTPDFFLEKTQEYIELKGMYRPKDLQKIERFKQENPTVKLTVLQVEDLRAMGFIQANYKKSMTFNVAGTPWRVEFLDFKEYASKHGSDSRGVTDIEKKLISLDIRSSTLETLRHELGHAYAAQRSLSELQLDEDQIEEFFCEIIGHYAKLIVNQADDIYREFKRLRGYVVGKAKK